MLLNRIGKKTAIAMEIIKYFPKHDCFIEPFFGAGGMFFSKPKARYNIVNDLDSDVFNLYQVITTRKTELAEALKLMPIHNDLFQYWKTNKETEPIKKATRFLFLSNFSFMGKADTLRFGVSNTKNNLLQNIDKTYHYIADVQFNNCDFERFLKSIANKEKDKTFIYCDPPYLSTENNYSHSFTKSDVIRLFDVLQDTGCKFAISEFDNDFVLEQAKQRNLNVITIGERKNLKNRRTEILITNYETHKTLFD